MVCAAPIQALPPPPLFSHGPWAGCTASLSLTQYTAVSRQLTVSTDDLRSRTRAHFTHTHARTRTHTHTHTHAHTHQVLESASQYQRTRRRATSTTRGRTRHSSFGTSSPLTVRGPTTYHTPRLILARRVITWLHCICQWRKMAQHGTRCPHTPTLSHSRTRGIHTQARKTTSSMLSLFPW
jgi:hypothetical protein